MGPVNLIADLCTCGTVGIASLFLLEFYAVITDGRKLRNPLPPSEACAVVVDSMAAEAFNVLDANAAIRAEAFRYAEKIGLSIATAWGWWPTPAMPWAQSARSGWWAP